MPSAAAGNAPSFSFSEEQALVAYRSFRTIVLSVLGSTVALSLLLTGLSVWIGRHAHIKLRRARDKLEERVEQRTAELRERDYFGQTVNRCARIRSLGRGGQTLVSASTRELIRSVAMEPLSFRDLGEQQLRDFQEPERVYEVVAQTGAGPTEPKQAAGI